MESSLAQFAARSLSLRELRLKAGGNTVLSII
jgi:hypothetical protein